MLVLLLGILIISSKAICFAIRRFIDFLTFAFYQIKKLFISMLMIFLSFKKRNVEVNESKI